MGVGLWPQSSAHLSFKFPHDDAGGDGDIHGMLRAVLRDFEGGIGGVNHILANTFHFVAENEGIALGGVDAEGVELQATFHLLNGKHFVAFALQALNSVERVFKIFPTDAVFSAEGGFVDFCGRRTSRDAAEPYALKAESIGGAEHAAYVVQAADIVENDDEGEFLRLVKRLDVHAVEFFNGEFAHNGYGIRGDEVMVLVILNRFLETGRWPLAAHSSSFR